MSKVTTSEKKSGEDVLVENTHPPNEEEDNNVDKLPNSTE